MLSSIIAVVSAATLSAWATPALVLTPDFGILGQRDTLSYLDQTDDPEAASNSALGRWVCGEAKDFQFRCRELSSDPGEWNADIDGIFRVGGFEHRYFGRRGIDMRWCVEFRERIRMLAYRQRYLCVAGYTEQDVQGIRPPVRTVVWTWDQVKTKRGKACYFGTDNCD